MKTLLIDTCELDGTNQFGILNKDTNFVSFKNSPFVHEHSNEIYILDYVDLLDKRFKKEDSFKKYVDGYKIEYL